MTCESSRISAAILHINNATYDKSIFALLLRAAEENNMTRNMKLHTDIYIGGITGSTKNKQLQACSIKTG